MLMGRRPRWKVWMNEPVSIVFASQMAVSSSESVARTRGLGVRCPR